MPLQISAGPIQLSLLLLEKDSQGYQGQTGERQGPVGGGSGRGSLRRVQAARHLGQAASGPQTPVSLQIKDSGNHLPGRNQTNYKSRSWDLGVVHGCRGASASVDGMITHLKWTVLLPKAEGSLKGRVWGHKPGLLPLCGGRAARCPTLPLAFLGQERHVPGALPGHGAVAGTWGPI